MTINDRGNNDGPMLVNENKNHRPNGYASTALISNGHGMEPKLPNDLASGQANVAGLDFVPFPALPVGVQQPFPDQTLKHQFPCAPREYQDTDAVTAVLGAWGLVVGAMVESDSHVFGIPISTRKFGSHKDHKDHSIAPVHVNCTKQQTIEDYLRQFQEQTIRTDWFAQGLSDESPKDHDTGSLQTLLHVRPQAMENGPTRHESREASHYALVLDVQLGENDMTVTACFDSRVIQPWLVQKLLERLDDATAQVYNADPKETLASIDNVTPNELEELWERNRDVPAPAERCVSEVIEETARTHPTAQAICAWDGSLSYRELDQLATLLAAQLVDLGVGPEVFVSLVFEKSMWTSVAILAVLKAGGAFVLLDTSLPEKRLQDMARQVESKLALSSSANYDLSTRLVEKVLTVTSDLFKPTGNADLYREIRSRASPSSAAYVVFTSGSTGTPKGVVITNQNVVSVFRQTDRLAFKPDSRVYDFPPYSFGLSILMCLPALAAGACLCVPNNQDRKNNLAHSIKSLGANVIWLTPSAAGTLSPATVPGLRMIGFGGEVAQLKDALAWWGHAEVRNGYGSSETSTLTALNAYPATPSEACHLGTGAGVLHWIVDPEDHNILLPIGSVGELLVEGPHVGRGYLNDPAKTKAAFIEDPTWLIRGSRRHRGRHGRLYKTGDLVQYTESGSLKMIGRKDMQVKIRGQRVELGEVEFRLRQIMPEVTQAVAEVIIPQGSNADPVLAAFLLSKRSDSIAKHNQAEPFPVPKEIEEKLAEHLPNYMIPTIFFSMSQLPMTATGKTNRKELRQVGGSFSTRQLADIQTAGNGPKLQPTTQIAQQIQEIWSRILGLDVQQIGLDDSFFKLGGNSVAIIKVVGEARKIGIQLEVTNIFRYPTLRDVAEKAVLVESSADDIVPYSLLGDDVDTSSILHEITADFQLDLHKVQDMYPCSPLQEGLFLLTSKRPGDYVMQLTLELSPDINVADFQRACEEVVRCNSILRTRIVQHKKLGMLQVVLDEGIHWIGASGLGHYLQTDREQAMMQGQPLTRYALVEGDTPSSRHFVWTVHHALYDGWSMPLIIDEIDRVYKGETLVPGPQFRSFIHHIRHQNKAKLADYWQQYLESCDCVPYPALPSSIDQPVADGFLERTIQAPGTHYDNVTQSTIIRAAWAVVAGRMTGSTDVVFGVTVSGRHASVPNMDQLAGPTIATVPVRVKLDESLSVGDYVKGLQQQSTDTIPYEQFGLQSIGKMSPEGRQACNFQTLIIVQPEDSSTVENAVGKWQYGDGQDQWTNTYPLTLDVYLDEEKMVVKAFFDSRVIGSEMVQTLLARLDYVIQQIDHAHSDQLLTEIEMLTTQDLQQIWEWNAAVPVAVESDVLDAIDRFTTLQPSAPALYAWDGELSYRDLTAKALSLASHLVGLGVRPGQIVPLCFEKSMWATVAILGVLKAGAAFVLLDPALPDQRLQAIVEQVKPTLVLSSVSNESRSLHLCGTALPISSEFFLTVGDEMRNELPRITTSSLMYVIFTSGSTGTPKGVMISHGNWASALHYQSADQGFTSRSRLYDFASYSFDTCVSNIFFTLGSGGCLCVPREQDRKDRLAESIRALRANLVELTPSVSLILGPSDVPGLESLVFGGEALRIKDVKPWWGKVQISNTYGPSECTPTSVMNCNPPTAEHAANIGKGSGVVTWVVDPQNHDVLLPPGCTGEMLLEGPLVGLGYLNDQQKTAAAFINDPAWLVRGAPGRPGRHGRLYKTGDLVQYREDGNLFYVGRKDDQVKIRGQRVELGEVEHWVQEFMQEATYVVAEVITPQGNQSAQTLVTFLEVENCEKELQKVSSSVSVLPIPADVEDRLGEHLPSYMVPSIFFIMPKLPIGPTGKRDRKQLRNIGCSFSAEQLAEMRTMGRGPKRQPTNELEQQMQSIWAQVLDIKSISIGIDDSFFQLGGNSIDAMIVAGEAHKIGLNVTAADIFLHRTLSKIIKECRLVDSSIVATIPNNKQDGPVLQSFAQERLWFLEQLHPGMTWYHMANAVRFRGPLRLDALHAAIQALENRHETLRTTFMSKDGVSMQTIHPFRPKDLTVIDHPLDENALQDVLQKEQRIPFDLTVEPGWRVKVFRLGKKDHVLSLVMHHIICDGWSVDVLRKELGTLYSAALKGDSNPLSQLDPLPKRYQDYSLWQRQEDQIAQQQPQLEYWVNELQGSRPAEFLCDKPRPASLSGKSDQQLVRIDGPLFDKIQRFCREHDVTPFIVLLAAFRSTHYRLSNQSIAAIGCPNANRDRWELKDMIGFFVNMQCYCIRIDDQSFREVVRQVEGQVTAAIANQDVPFERVVANLQSERDMSRNPLVQTIFALHPQININRITLEGLDATQIPFLSASRFDLEFHLYQEETAFQGGILYSTDLYHPETIRALLSVFQEILEQGLSDPDTPVASLPLLTETDFNNVKDMGLIDVHKTNYPRELNILDVFRQQVGACPNRVAVKDSSAQLTYTELDQKSEALARWLASRQFAPEKLIGIFGNRSCETVVSILGILKANLAYLPFDDKVPASRMETILSSIPADRLVLVGSHVQVPHIQLEKVEFVQIADTLKEPYVGPGVSATPSPSSLAYVMFTSGSTGQPKGVMIEHRNILRLAKESNMMDRIPPNVVMGHIASLAFDASTWEIYTALLNGGTLICIDRTAVLDTRAVARTFAQEGVQAIFITPLLLKQYLHECPGAIEALEMLVVGGDRLDPKDMVKVRELMAGDILNGYGPTENTSFSTFYRLQRDGSYGNGVPIGRSLSNSGAYVMDSKLRLVPFGVVGELVVTGDGLARGYTDPGRNVDRFVSITIGGQTVRAYRTGDYVRYRPKDGELEILGRGDGQVKIRGQRVEVGEVEHVLRSHDAVSNAVVIPTGQGEHTNQLVAVVTAKDDWSNDSSGNVVESEHHGDWEERFDSDIYLPMDNVDAENIGRDFIGWTSMYDGKDIDKMEMNEWLDDTMEAILNAGDAGHVLEIGTGSGMILFNLGKGLQSYTGLDPSERAVRFVTKGSKAVPALAGRVHMFKATAADINRMELPVSPDLAIINSVAQYFPSEGYLFRLVEALLHRNVRTIFFGDMRSYALHRQFLASRALYMAGKNPDKNVIRKIVDNLETAETEFLTDPGFFTALADRLPELVGHVEILPKRMNATNELSCYRYAAVIHAKDHDKPTQQVYETDDTAWIDFMEQGLDRESLLQLLRRPTNSSLVAISNIPHKKTIFERFVVESLGDGEDEAQDPGSWISNARQKGQNCPSLSSVDLIELAEEAGFRVEISWARQFSQSGGLDAIFHHHQPADNNGKRVLFRFPTDHKNRQFGTAISSRPLRRGMENLEVELSQLVEAHLPSYMVPQKIAVLDEIPLNSNGKVDRRVLGKLIQSWTADHGPVQQPTLEAQLKMQGIWAEVLHEKPSTIGVDANFFKLGGNSIAAMRVAAEACKIGFGITVADIFRYPQLDQLTRQGVRSSTETSAGIPRTEYTGPVEQSFAQGRLWFIEELHPGSTAYLMPRAMRIRGPLHIKALHTALRAIETRHETLRTTFSYVDSLRLQEVQPVQTKDLEIVSISPDDQEALEAALERDRTTVFDLHNEPGWRVTLYKLAEDDYVLSVVMHHIISDGWSVDVLCRELGAFYSNAIRGQDPLSEIAPLPIQYRDYSVWQKTSEQISKHEKQLRYWTKQLQDSRPAELLCDKPRPTVLSGHAEVETYSIDGPLYDKLQQFCQARSITPFTALLTVFRIAQFRLTGQHDATIGILNANRQHWELKDMIGFFVNMQCIRTKIEAEGETFEDTLQQVHETVADALLSQDVPFDILASKLQRGRDLSRNPLVQLIFVVHSQHNLGRLELEGVQTEILPEPQTSGFDLEFHFYPVEGGLRGEVLFSTDLYLPESIRNLLSVFHDVLAEALEKPTAATKLLPSMTPNAFRQLDQLDLVEVDRHAYPRMLSVVDLFRQQVEECGPRIAVRDSSKALTYSQLDILSDKVSEWLVTRSFPAEALVGVFSDRCCETIVAFLAILKANLAYLPFDIKTPPGRMETILSSIPGKKIVLVGPGQTPPVQLEEVQFVSLSDVLAEVCDNSKPLIPIRPSSTCLAYVMFTSGSTGKPKGVMVEHRGIVRLVKQSNMARYLHSIPIVAHVTNIAFDVSTWEIYSALLNGGTLVCIEYMKLLDHRAMAETFAHERVETAIFAPALLKQCISENPAYLGGLNTLFVAGDRADARDMLTARKYVDNVVNAYGPTENSVISTLYCMPDGEDCVNGVPIGRSITNSGAYVVDEKQRIVPLGVIGELVVTGDGLARGYTDPQYNDRFITLDVGGEQVRAYRTGDYVRYRPVDGQLEFFGRLDGQVKLRGHRIELREVEHALRTHKSVQEAVVILHQEAGQEPELAGFVTVDQQDAGDHTHDVDAEVLETQLRNVLRHQLPPYMVPRYLSFIDKMPVNANGKVDRRALTDGLCARKDRPAAQGQPATEAERQMQSIWAKVLRIDVATIGTEDDFFLLGANSIAAMNVVAEARKMGMSLEVADLFKCPTIAELASLPGLDIMPVLGEQDEVVLGNSFGKEALLQEVESANIGIETRDVEDIFPVTSLQDEFMSHGIRSGQFCNYFYLDMEADVDLPRLEKSCVLATEKFPLLRSRFVSLFGKFWQILLHSLGKNLHVVEVSEDLDSFFHSFCAADAREFSPTQPPFGFTTLRQKNGPCRLVLRMSHAQYDGLSLPIIAETIMAGYLDTASPEAANFSIFLSYAQRHRAESIKYWQKLLQGSSPTTTQCLQSPLVKRDNQLHSAPKDFLVEAQTAWPKLPPRATCAALVSAAWAILLSCLTGKRDIVYGHLVAGRNAPVQGIERVVGPCVNIIPIRAHLPSIVNASELLGSVQDQLISLKGADSLGFKDIINECTSWPSCPNFDFVIQHQNVDERPVLESGSGDQYQLHHWLNPERTSPFKVFMISYPQGDHLRLTFIANTQLFSPESAKVLLDGLVKLIAMMADGASVSSSFPLDDIELGVE